MEILIIVTAFLGIPLLWSIANRLDRIGNTLTDIKEEIKNVKSAVVNIREDLSELE